MLVDDGYIEVEKFNVYTQTFPTSVSSKARLFFSANTNRITHNTGTSFLTYGPDIPVFTTFAGRPTNLTETDADIKYIYKRTGNIHRWDGGQWAVLNQNIINVLDYGVVGDGSTDDTSAIQAILNTYPSAMYFPEGNYVISSSLNVYYFLVIIGAPNGWTGNNTVDLFRTVFKVNTLTGYLFTTYASVCMENVYIKANNLTTMSTTFSGLFNYGSPGNPSSLMSGLRLYRVAVGGNNVTTPMINLTYIARADLDEVAFLDVRGGACLSISQESGTNRILETIKLEDCYFSDCRQVFNGDKYPTCGAAAISFSRCSFYLTAIVSLSYNITVTFDECSFISVGAAAYNITNKYAMSTRALDPGTTASGNVYSIITACRSLVQMSNCNFGAKGNSGTAWFEGVDVGKKIGCIKLDDCAFLDSNDTQTNIFENSITGTGGNFVYEWHQSGGYSRLLPTTELRKLTKGTAVFLLNGSAGSEEHVGEIENGRFIFNIDKRSESPTGTTLVTGSWLKGDTAKSPSTYALYGYTGSVWTLIYNYDVSSGGSGGGASGTATIDFGSTGDAEARVTVSCPTVLTTSVIFVCLNPEGTADNGPDEVLLQTSIPKVTNVIPSTSFDIVMIATDVFNIFGTWSVNWKII